MIGLRQGTVCLLGAGASAEAGYPMANALLHRYRKLLEHLDDGMSYVGPVTGNRFTQAQIFDRFWSIFDAASTGKASYLEDFFAHFDSSRNVGKVLAEDWGPQVKHFEMKMLRRFRNAAIELAYAELGAHDRQPAAYLRPLFSLEAPTPYLSAIATLNFDVCIEQLAHLAQYRLFDGFQKIQRAAAPPGWDDEKLRNLLKRWDHISSIGYDFVGFDKAPAESHLLLKLHGSLGWYCLEEGAESIGEDENRRHNPGYRYFRTPYHRFWEERLTNDEQILGVGQYGNSDISRKAGAVWMNPYMAYARAYKAKLDPLTLEIFRTFAKLVDAAETVVVVGYSWSDPHVNDLLLGGVARGGKLVNVGSNPLPEGTLRLWRNKFRSTFDVLKRRMFVFGGGAKRCFTESKVALPNGEDVALDIVEAIRGGVPQEFSLEQKLPA